MLHIWIARQLTILPFGIEECLSPGEHDRALRFRFGVHQSRFKFARGVLRDVLGRYLNCRPSEIRFAANPFGKPFLEPSALEFNLSHSGELVLIAVSTSGRVGVDVEEIRSIKDLSAIAESHYTPEECAFIFRQPATDRYDAFFQCWTRKEAYVKAVGEGLSIPLNSFETLISPHERVRRLGSGWELADLDVPEGYRAAIAVEAGISQLEYFEWRPRS